MTPPSGAGKLGVVCCHFNPCGYRSRLSNYYRFREALKRAPVHLLTVELAFGEEPFEIEPDETELVRLRSNGIMWQKERLLNHGLRKLAGDGYGSLCYLDADIVFDEADWADRVLEALGRHRFVQVFETVHRFGRDAPGAASLLRTEPARVTVRRQGGGWAVRREAFEQTMLYEHLIVGGADSLMFWATLRHPRWARFREEVEPRFQRLREGAGKAMAADIDRWAPAWTRAIDGDLGFAANRIVGLPHGPREARQYGVRLRMLEASGFDPGRHLDGSGGAFDWDDAPPGLARDLIDYFRARDEDAPEETPVEA